MNPVFPVNDFGWIDRPDEVEKMLHMLPQPELTSSNSPSMDQKKEVFLYKPFREVVKSDPPKGPQKIGDCVSWGWGNLINYIAALQIFNQLKAANLLSLPPADEMMEADFNKLVQAKAAITEQYQETATEATYALSRVEIGGQRGSRSDGSTGIWASRACVEKGSLSRPYLEKRLGAGKGQYDGNRAKQWGASGLPDELEPDAVRHILKTTSIVRNFEDAFAQIQNGYPVAVCSNRGFTMTRDSQGFCSPSGVWNHCMLFMAGRLDRPGLCCSQSWGQNTPNGPTVLDQPDNTFWVDEKVVNYMLSQNDSYTGSQFEGYPEQDFVDWRF